MDIKNIIANNIYLLRTKHDLTQQEFAYKLANHITRGHISKIENANHIPSAEFIKIVAEKFNISTDWLLSNNIIIDDKPCNLAITPEDIELLLKINNLPANLKQKILDLIETINKNLIKDTKKQDGGT